MSHYDKTRRQRVDRATRLLSPLNADGSFRTDSSSSGRSAGYYGNGPPSSPSKKGKEREPEPRTEADWADELVSTLERVMLATAERRKQGFKPKKGANAPVRRSDMADIEDRRLWLVWQCHDLVRKGRDKLVSTRRGIKDELGIHDKDLAIQRLLIHAALQDIEDTLEKTQASFDQLQTELQQLDIQDDNGSSASRHRRSGRSPARSPTRPVDVSSDRRRNEIRSELGMSPPNGHIVKIERLKRFEDDTKQDRFRRSLDHRGLEIRGLGNKRRNLGNVLYLTDALYPELDQDEDQSMPPLPPQASGPITLPSSDKSLRATLRRLYFPAASSGHPVKKSGINVNTKRPYPKIKFRGKPFRKTSSSAPGSSSTSPGKSSANNKHPPLSLTLDDSATAALSELHANLLSSEELPWLRIQTISSMSDIEDKPDLVAQAGKVLRTEFVKMGCEISSNRVVEGVEEGFGLDLVILCTPHPRDRDSRSLPSSTTTSSSTSKPQAVKEEVVAICERTFMRSYIWIHHLCVQAKYQASGLGTWLIERCKEMVRSRKKEGILLFALNEVVGWYQKQGFADFELIPARPQDWGGDRVMIWRSEASPVSG